MITPHLRYPVDGSRRYTSRSSTTIRAVGYGRGGLSHLHAHTDGEGER